MIEDNSVVLVTAGRAIQYFDFEKFFQDCNRILKPGGELQFCVKEEAKYFDKQVYANTDWEACLGKMENNGFDM